MFYLTLGHRECIGQLFVLCFKLSVGVLPETCKRSSVGGVKDNVKKRKKKRNIMLAKWPKKTKEEQNKKKRGKKNKEQREHNLHQPVAVTKF